MKNRTIGVLMGGLSSEREVSLRSGEAALAALRGRGYRALPIYVDRDLDLVLRQTRIDVAFIALHGRYGEDGCVQGLLETMGIPYTGSDVLASALAMHKVKSKELFRLHNLPTPAYYVADADDADHLGRHGDFGFPCVVKPAREGSSVGVSPPASASVSRLTQAAITCRRTAGVTTNCAPASIAAPASSGRSTEPTPTQAASPSARRVAAIASIAPLPVSVNSSTRTPPASSARASSTARSYSASRTIATILCSRMLSIALICFPFLVFGPRQGDKVTR